MGKAKIIEEEAPVDKKALKVTTRVVTTRAPAQHGATRRQLAL